jgi:3-oxoacyl-[acyl-carrier protein] reductase
MKSVLVTGATSGIGRATAKKFAAEGYFVYCHGRDSSSDFSVADEIEAETGGRVKRVVADFAHEDEIRRMFEEFSEVDVLVNAAGIVQRVQNLKPAEFRQTLEINVVALYLCCELAKERGVSSIVNIGSMQGLDHFARRPDYAASKAAVHNLTVALARAYAPDCRVNCVAPGFTKTGMHQGMLDRLMLEAEKTPLKMFALPEDIAETVFFVASEKARFMTGEIVVLDGGRSFAGA